MNINKELEPISLQIHYGEGNETKRDSLLAYKYENELKREVAKKERAVRYHLFNKFDIPFEFDVKVSEPGEKPTLEHFSIIELINDKLTSINAKLCISTYKIYKEKGIEEAIANLHGISNLTLI